MRADGARVQPRAAGSLHLQKRQARSAQRQSASEKLEGARQGNVLANCCINCCRCCLDCFHRFVKFLNDNAYCQMALSGESFCTSAIAAFTLALKHSSTFLMTNGIGALLRFLGRITICMTSTLFGYLIINLQSDIREDIDNPIIILAVIFIISWSLATVFMEVYSVTSLAILQCLYADIDICN